MSRSGRIVALAGAAAILPIVALSLPAQAEAPAAPAPAFTPPEAPMVLTRMLRRPLREGKAIISLRSYKVRFIREANGFRVDGELLAVTVDAPPGLQALAQIERRRPDTGLFPMHLDAAGMLIAGGYAPPSATQREAVRQVSSDIGGLHHLGPAETAQAHAFIGQLGQGVGHTPWPRDLFRPTVGKRQEHRLIPLPNGGRGHVTVDLDVTLAGDLLASLSRRVSTDMEGDLRVTLEEWTLIPAPEA